MRTIYFYVLQAGLEELSKAEKEFDDQFKSWEDQFNTWKEQNKNHPDRVNYSYWHPNYVKIILILLGAICRV